MPSLRIHWAYFLKKFWKFWIIANGYPFGGIKENKDEKKKLQRVCITFSKMPHHLRRIKLCAIRCGLSNYTTEILLLMLYEWERSYTYSEKDLTPISLRVRVIFGPIFLRVAQSVYRRKIHSTLKDLDIGPTLTWMFFWTFFSPMSWCARCFGACA